MSRSSRGSVCRSFADRERVELASMAGGCGAILVVGQVKVTAGVELEGYLGSTPRVGKGGYEQRVIGCTQEGHVPILANWQ